MRLGFLLLLFFICPLLADGTAREIDVAGSPRVEHRDGAPVLIEGIILVPGGVGGDSVEQVPGVHSLLDEPVDQELFDSLRVYLNHPLSEELLKKIRVTITDYFKNYKNQYVAVIIPVQNVNDGVVVFQVFIGKVGNVIYKGQKWFTQKCLEKAIRIYPGDPMVEPDLLNAVTWANRNAFRSTRMILAPSLEKGLTDVLFVTKDRFPARFFVGSDNTGYRTNGTIRLYGGFNWGDVFWSGDLVSYQYTASTDFHKFQSHIATYNCFISSKKHLLKLFGVYGSVFPQIRGFAVSGINVQGSLRYQIPFLPLYGSFRHQTEWGGDYKYLTSNLFFLGDAAQGGTATGTHTITVSQLASSYFCERNWPKDYLSFKIDMLISPWQNLFPHQNKASYDASRQSSHVRYAYWRGMISNIYRSEKKVTLSIQAQGQLATGTLPTSEQFGLGGFNTVRGYYEQQFVADNAFCLNVEVFAPSFPILKNLSNELALVAFVDYGYGYNYSVSLPVFVHQNLLGVGGGARYVVSRYLDAEAYYGFQGLAIEGNAQLGRFHFSLTASY